MSKLPKVLITFLLWITFALVVWQIPYPRSLTDASLFQIILFFIPLFLAVTFTLYLFIKSFLICVFLSLGIVSTLVLKALDSFNFVTLALIIVAEYLLVSSFKKGKGLTKDSGMPKLRSLHRKK